MAPNPTLFENFPNKLFYFHLEGSPDGAMFSASPRYILMMTEALYIHSALFQQKDKSILRQKLTYMLYSNTVTHLLTPFNYFHQSIPTSLYS